MYACICVYMCVYLGDTCGRLGGGVTRAADWRGKCDTCGRLVNCFDMCVYVYMCEYVYMCVYVCKCVYVCIWQIGGAEV